mgnify:CR=1 FL=1
MYKSSLNIPELFANFIRYNSLHTKGWLVVKARDFHGKTCSREIKNFIYNYFEKSNYTFSFNYPYAGQNIIKNFSSLDYGISAIQLEVNKRLYMNEKEVTPYSDNTKIINFLYDFIEQLKNFMVNLNENKIAAE